MRTLLVLLVQLGRMSQPKVAAGLAVVVCASQVHSDDDALMNEACQSGTRSASVEGAKGECVRAGTDWAARGGGSRQRLPALGRCESGDAVFKGGVFQPFRRLQDFSCEAGRPKRGLPGPHRLSSETTGTWALRER